MEKQTLLKLLISYGQSSRRKVVAAIREGRISVNGITVEDLLYPVDPSTDTIEIDHIPLKARHQSRVILLLNKPAGVLSVTSDTRGRKTVIDILPQPYKGLKLHPVGRLDKDSTGLLLLTNDGDLTYRLTHPRFEHEKEYYATIKDRLSPSDIQKFTGGLVLEDGLTFPARIKEIKQGNPFTYSIVIHEGRKRQIRRMFQATGHTVTALKRVRMGGLHLGKLAEGKVRTLSRLEEKQLLAPPGITPPRPHRHPGSR